MTSNRNRSIADVAVVEPPPAAVDISAPCAAVRSDPVLLAAYEVLLDVGPGKATLAEVARRAGLSRMTVYRRYEQLSALVSAVLTHELVALLEAARAKAEGADDAQRIASVIGGAARGIAGHPLMLRLIDLDPASLLPQLVTRRGSTQRAGEALLASMLRASTDESLAPSDPDLTARMVTTAASGFIYTEALARREGDDGTRWVEFTKMIEGYLS